MKAEEIVAALGEHYHQLNRWRAAPKWIWFDELRVATGYGRDSGQRFDFWAMNCYPSERAMVAYEVKVSRADFMAEMRRPKKRRFAVLYSTEFYFAAPQGLIAPSEIPPEAGLVEIGEHGLSITLPAPIREAFPPTWGFVGAIGRRALERVAEEGGTG